MKLKTIMTENVEVVAPDCTVQEAAQKMETCDIGAIPVCDGEKLLGMVTDRDITVRCVARGLDPRQATVRDIVSQPIIFGYEEMTVEEAARLMEVKQIRRLVVLNGDKKLVGVVALGDLATKSSESLAGEALEKISEPTKGVAA